MIAKFALIYSLIAMLVSLVTFAIYGWDKRQAKKKGWRTPEKTLHILAFLGGWPGAMFGQNFFRHKTQKLSFKLMTWAAALLHVLIFALVIYLGMKN
ncbi:MAG: DUF1294 domain-containing protein [Mariniblastus sp.]